MREWTQPSKAGFAIKVPRSEVDRGCSWWKRDWTYSHLYGTPKLYVCFSFTNSHTNSNTNGWLLPCNEMPIPIGSNYKFSVLPKDTLARAGTSAANLLVTNWQSALPTEPQSIGMVTFRQQACTAWLHLSHHHKLEWVGFDGWSSESLGRSCDKLWWLRHCRLLMTEQGVN